MGLPAFVAFVITSRGWVSYAKQLDVSYPQIVKEFYANLWAHDEDESQVRGVTVSFSPITINDLFDLVAPEVNEHEEFVATYTADDMNAILTELTIPNTQWQVSQQEAYTILRNELTPHTRVWYHFLKHNLMPTAHTETVSFDCLMLLYFLMTGKSMDVGKLITAEIKACALRDRSSLCFPGLITELCFDAGVPSRKDEEFVPDSRLIKRQTIAHIQKEAEAANGAVAVNRTAAVGEHPAPEPHEGAAPSVDNVPVADNAAATATDPVYFQNEFQQLNTRLDHLGMQQHEMEKYVAVDGATAAHLLGLHGGP